MPGFGLGFGWLLGRQPEAPQPAAVTLPASDGDAPAPERPSSPAPGESRSAPPMSAERPARRRPSELKVRRTEGDAPRIGLPDRTQHCHSCMKFWRPRSNYHDDLPLAAQVVTCPTITQMMASCPRDHRMPQRHQTQWLPLVLVVWALQVFSSNACLGGAPCGYDVRRATVISLQMITAHYWM